MARRHSPHRPRRRRDARLVQLEDVHGVVAQDLATLLVLALLLGFVSWADSWVSPLASTEDGLRVASVELRPRVHIHHLRSAPTLAPRPGRDWPLGDFYTPGSAEPARGS